MMVVMGLIETRHKNYWKKVFLGNIVFVLLLLLLFLLYYYYYMGLVIVCECQNIRKHFFSVGFFLCVNF